MLKNDAIKLLSNMCEIRKWRFVFDFNYFLFFFKLIFRRKKI